MSMLSLSDTHEHTFANAVVAATGVGYFVAWSVSFYPQLILNYKRKKTTGLSPDFVIVNPVGFLALSIWNLGIYFSPLARTQYQARHDGHLPQVAAADLAFALHALFISIIALAQVLYYGWKNRKNAFDGERQPLIEGRSGVSSIVDMAVSTSTIKPSLPFQILLVGITISSLVAGALVWIGKAEFLDWLYFVSTLKLVITTVKYLPQVLLNYRLKSTEGLSMSVFLLDLTGSFLSFTQLAISSIFLEHDPSGIIANPAKLGLSMLSVTFDLVFIVQIYWLYTNRRVKSGEEEEDGS